MIAALSRLALGYDVRRRYAVALGAHLAWKQWRGSAYEVQHFAWLNLLEFALWLGAPVALLAVSAAVVGLVESVRRVRPSPGSFATAWLATVGLLAWFGRTKAESARLWLFLVQPACLAASLALHRAFPRKGRLALGAVWVTQFLVVLSMKLFQDFH